ncbi:MAG: hypothetical protein K6B65_01685 [Bacilli bacterium]|nr:hypothetical protein [Bacilli bacterium]
MEKRRVYGNGFGQFLLFLAVLIGLVGNGYFTYLALNSFGFDKFAEIFANTQTMLSFLLIAIPTALLLASFILIIVGAAGRKRGASLAGIIFMVLSIVAQGAGYVALIADFSAGISFEAGVPLGKSLSLFAHFGMLGLAFFGFLGSVWVMDKKRGGAVIFGILALICGLAAAGLGAYVLLANSYSEPFVLYSYFSSSSLSLLDKIFIAGRFVYVGLYALAMFAFAFFRKSVAVKEKKEEPAKEEKKVEEKKKKDKKDDKKDDDDHNDDDNGGTPSPDVKVINDPFNDRIIIEIR